jgi:malate permease and related proteins
MNEFPTLLNAVIPVFAIAGAGFVMRKLNWLTEEADQSLLRVVVNVLMPCLILDKTLGNAALWQLSNLTLAPLVGFGTVAFGMLVAMAVRRLAGLRGASERRTFALTVGLYNYGYVPLPLALLLFGNQTAGVLFVHNVGVELAMWTLGLMLVSGQAGWKQIINAPFLAIVAALALNFSGLHAWLPQALTSTTQILGQCAIPFALILIGATVADHMDQFHSAAGWRVIAVATLLRIGLLPVLFLLLARHLPATLELKQVMVLEAAMPSAVFPIVMARHYGGDTPTALRVVIGTSALSLLTIPLWIRFGMSFVGL